MDDNDSILSLFTDTIRSSECNSQGRYNENISIFWLNTMTKSLFRRQPKIPKMIYSIFIRTFYSEKSGRDYIEWLNNTKRVFLIVSGETTQMMTVLRDPNIAAIYIYNQLSSRGESRKNIQRILLFSMKHHLMFDTMERAIMFHLIGSTRIMSNYSIVCYSRREYLNLWKLSNNCKALSFERFFKKPPYCKRTYKKGYINACRSFGKTPTYQLDFLSPMEVFYDFCKCIKYIRRNQYRQIIFLICGSDYNDVFNYMQHDPVPFLLPHILCIYVLPYTSKFYGFQWNDYEFLEKERNIYYISDSQCLFDELHHDIQSELEVLQMRDQQIDTDGILTNRTLNTEKFQVLVESMMQLPQSEQSKKEMLENCRLRYHDADQSDIDEFETTYDQTAAIHWYTKDSFLYRLLNEACRTQDIDLMFTFRFFIKDLNSQIQTLHAQFINNHQQESLTVYRGQYMTKQEFDIIRKEEQTVYSFNGFISASLSSTVALQFIPTPAEALESVFFEIEIDTNVNAKPYADVTEFSTMSHECEFLFSIGTTFQVVQIENLSDIWHIKLRVLENSKTTQLHSDIPILLQMGNYLREKKEFEKAERYYYLFIQNESSLNLMSDMAMAYVEIARLCILKEEISSSVENYEKAIRCYGDDGASIVEVYNSIGNMHHELFNFELAINAYKDALSIILNSTDPVTSNDKAKLGTIYENIAGSYYCSGDKRVAVVYDKKASLHGIGYEYLEEEPPKLDVYKRYKENGYELFVGVILTLFYGYIHALTNSYRFPFGYVLLLLVFIYLYLKYAPRMLAYLSAGHKRIITWPIYLVYFGILMYRCAIFYFRIPPPTGVLLELLDFLWSYPVFSLFATLLFIYHYTKCITF